MVQTAVPSAVWRRAKSPLEVGWAEALFGEQGPSLGAVRRGTADSPVA
jgi:hypothetical protein